MVEIAALLLGTIVTSLIALVVFVKDIRSLTNKFFIGISVGLVGWSVATYFSLHTSSDADTLLWIRRVMVFVVIQNTCFFFLSRIFPHHESGIFKLRVYRLAVAYSIVVALISMSPFLFTDFKDGAPVPGPGMVLFMLHAVLFAGGGVVTLYLRFRRAQGALKMQLQYFLFGTLLLFTLVPLGNFVIPVVFKLSHFVVFSPLYAVVFSGFIAYAIVSKKLFDIKSAATRSVAYILSLIFVTFFYGLIIFIATSIFNVSDRTENSQRLFYIGVAVLSSFLLQPFRSYFDKITNRLFFRDAYDPQSLTDELNDTLVGGIDLEALLTKSALILQEHMKISFCTFYIRETSYLPSRVIGAHRKDPEIDRMDELHKLSPKLHHKVHTAEPNDDSEVGRKVTNILRRNDIELMVRLVSTLDYEVEGVGYIFLGAKRSGGIYSDKDMKFLETIGNELVIAIQNVLRFEEIEHFNVTLQKKIDSATGELKSSNEKLLALDEAKDEFVSMASHQLRTPLTSIKGYVSMVLEGDAGEINKTQKQMLGQALFSSQRMVYLISDLLNVSRLRTGKFLIESTPIQLMDIVESEINQLKEGAAAKNITLSFSKPDKLPLVELDDMKIRQVIMNFIDNAIYYTPQGGKIAVELKNRRSSVEFTVKDSGIGVPKDEMHKLFAKFYRAENARKARPDGTGLGLFMAKKVVVALGGSIIFDSKENKGSTFGFTFPKTKKPTKSDKPKTS